MMNSYFKNYLFRIIKCHSKDFLIHTFFFIFMMFLIFLNKEYSETVFVVGSILIILSRSLWIKPVQANGNYQMSGSLLLPMSKLELTCSNILKSFFSLYPLYLIFVSLISLTLIQTHQIPTWNVVLLISYLCLIVLISKTIHLMRIEFKKLNMLQKVLSFTRFASFYSIPVLFIIVFHGHFKLIPILLFSFLFFVVACFYLLLKDIDGTFLNEHLVYKNKNFKWFDVLGVLAIVYIGIVFFNTAAPKNRKPANQNIYFIKK